jgi:Rad3-related DNA helicase
MERLMELPKENDGKIVVTDSTRDIWDYWAMPNSEPRPSQRTALDIMANLPAHKKYIMCQIPVGGGKSPIAVSYASFLGRGALGSSYILTPQRILQRQYEESFEDNLLSVYGKANYMCNTKIGLNCDVGNDIKPKCNNCPAKAAFESIGTTPHAVLNYKLAMLYSELFPGDSESFPVKDLMVFDECHTLEGHLVDHRAVAVSKYRCDMLQVKYYKPKSIEDAHGWLIDTYQPAVDSRYFSLHAMNKAIDEKYEFSTGSLLPSEIKTKKDYKDITRHRALVKSLTDKTVETISEKYVLVKDDKEFQLKEIYGADLFKRILEPKADRFLFMSSTILNFEAYAKDLGIPVEETEIISLDSEFDPDNRPVYFMPTAKMTYGWNGTEKVKVDARNKMVSKIVELCKIHSDDCGIIHTGSFQISNWLVKELKGKVGHEIITHSQDSDMTRDECIEIINENDGRVPMLLISPSMTEGLDLKDDKARFAIFAKVPYPFLGDEWVKRRLDLSDEWYQRQAMTAIIQGGGRVVRSEDDWGNVYILDESFNFLWYKFKRLTPDWWKEAFVKVK